ncbi:hypothetical protein N7462_003268 [Penicillium macrosclerotiorum]|uniref:uncharacterized protein n=1 Tax=Penicillium macrosclerotiorum TaxID=303699 RepID=UPI00254933FE|nr:uncharacterized protein N7462_003268 [Penicillium macrosclerotiorum]KAJ5688876.1 hypothetical protein N7462_003268 [Penicillium macrosclerotiorum]
MYESTTTVLSLHRLSRQSLRSLQKRYESDEEDVSESDAGGHDFVPSLVGSQRAAGAFDSDLSADENSHMDPDSDRDEQLLAPYRGAKRQRPVSMDTVKRSSDATFDGDAYVFDPEQEMVLELPSPDSPDPLASSLFLQPTIYVAPNGPPSQSARSRSSSPSSIFSVEHAEIHVAKKITLMEPPTRPALVFINSLSTRSKVARSRPSRSRTRGNTRDRDSRIFDGRFENGVEVPPLTERKPSALKDQDSDKSVVDEESSRTTPATSPTSEDTPRITHRATINRVSEIPVLPYFPPSPQMRPQSMYRARPRTSGSEKPFPGLASARSRRPTDPARRPASIRTNSNSSVPSSLSRPTSPLLADDPRLGYIPDYQGEVGSSLSRTCSPASSASSPPIPHPSTKRSHTGTGYSMSNILAQRSPMMRRMTRKHSASSSIHSMSSLRSEMDTVPLPAAASQSSLNMINHDSHVVRKPSQRRHARHNSSVPTGRGFMGLKLGKKAFTKA